MATVILIVSAVFYVSTVQLNGSDFWLQAKVGELIAINHTIPDTLLFPFTEIASEKFNAHEWFASLLFHGLLQWLGEGGMPLFIGFLGLVFFAQMAVLAWLRGHASLPPALGCALLAVAVENYRHVLRPELISLIWMGFLWIFLELFRRHARWWQAALVLGFLVLWVNSHGSFILGPVLILIYAAGAYLTSVRASGYRHWWPAAEAYPLMGLGLAACVCCLINPFGLELVRFAIGFGGNSGLQMLAGEWMPTLDRRVLGLRGFWIALSVWCLMLVSLLNRKKERDFTDILVLVAFSILASRAIRFPVYLGMVAACVLPGSASASWASITMQRRLYQICCALAGAGLLLAMKFGNASGSSPFVDPTGTKFSAAMVSAVSDPARSGNVLNSMELGPELIYRAYPRLKPASDVRLDSYGTKYLTYQETLFYDDGHLMEFVRRYDVRYVLVNTRTFAEFQKLASWKAGTWRVVLVDTRAALLQRSDLPE
jgi:hypothetical protein